MSGMGEDPSLALGEQPVAILHPHWKVLVRPVVLTAAVMAGLLAGEVLIPAGTPAATERLALAGVAVVLLLWWLAYPLLRWRTTVYELTTRRMRLRDGILTRRGRDIPLSRITDVSFRKGMLDRVLGCGTLVVGVGRGARRARTDRDPARRAGLVAAVPAGRRRAAGPGTRLRPGWLAPTGRLAGPSADRLMRASVLPWLYDLIMTRVLLAEDDTSISEPLSRALRREGYQVEVTEDGPATLGRALSDGIDLILLDIGLPEAGWPRGVPPGPGRGQRGPGADPHRPRGRGGHRGRA